MQFGVICFLSTAVLLAQDRVPPTWSRWLPVTPEERTLQPVVEPQAGVEALFWRVHVIDDFSGGDLQRALYHYVRLKVFTPQGQQKATTITIPYGSLLSKESISMVSGRTIKADGTVLELKSDAIHDREVVRIGRLREHVLSFAMPGVEPDTIVEYKWRELR